MVDVDIVLRLLNRANDPRKSEYGGVDEDLDREAAAEITRLRADHAELRTIIAVLSARA